MGDETSSDALSTPTAQTTPKLLVAYVPKWLGGAEMLPRLIDIHQAYNVLILFFAARPSGTDPSTGTVIWPGFEDYANANGIQTYLVQDIATCRSRKQKILVSIGGQDNQVLPTTRDQSQAFVDSVVAINNQLGGIDGIDLNTYEGEDQNPSLAEYTWIGKTLKSKFGTKFMITTPPAPWYDQNQTFCTALVKAGVVDLVMPQYYGGPDLAYPSYMLGPSSGDVGTWANLVAQNHLVPLFGIDPSPGDGGEYTTASDAATTWSAVSAKYPQLAGCGIFHLGKEISSNYAFASKI